MNPRTLLSLVLGLLTLTSMACGPTSLYYHDVYFPRDPIGEGRREWLVAEIDKALGSKINHLEYETPEGALTVYPRPEGTDESSLPRLPLVTLEVLRTAIDRGLRGDRRKTKLEQQVELCLCHDIERYTGPTPRVIIRGDIVFVPGAGGISPINLAKEAVNTFVRLVAANEGSRAGAPNAQSIGVNVNIGGGSN